VSEWSTHAITFNCIQPDAEQTRRLLQSVKYVQRFSRDTDFCGEFRHIVLQLGYLPEATS
jgi:hypothetical protein